MKTIKTLMLLGIISSMASLLMACSDNEDSKDSQNSKNEARGDHVWKHQTDALQISKDAAKKLQEQLNQQQQKLDENN